MELMLVLVTIGVMASLIAPALAEVVAGERQRSAAVALHKLIRDTRTRAVELGVAHAIHYQKTTSGLGRVEVYMGMNQSCTQSTNHKALRGTPLEMIDYNPKDGSSAPDEDDSGRHVITLRVTSGFVTNDPDDIWVCWQPNKLSFANAGAAAAWTAQANPIVFTVRRSMAGGTRGVNREVYLPLSGGPRLR